MRAFLVWFLVLLVLALVSQPCSSLHVRHIKSKGQVALQLDSDVSVDSSSLFGLQPPLLKLTPAEALKLLPNGKPVGWGYLTVRTSYLTALAKVPRKTNPTEADARFASNARHQAKLMALNYQRQLGLPTEAIHKRDEQVHGNAAGIEGYDAARIKYQAEAARTGQDVNKIIFDKALSPSKDVNQEVEDIKKLIPADAAADAVNEGTKQGESFYATIFAKCQQVANMCVIL